MDTILLNFLACFGLAAGFFIGSGNRAGIVGAIVSGLLLGLLLDVPFLRDGSGTTASTLLLFASTTLGAFIVNFISDDNVLKRRCRDQKSLKIRIGAYYRLGRD
jgi:hypothetical protein